MVYELHACRVCGRTECRRPALSPPAFADRVLRPAVPTTGVQGKTMFVRLMPNGREIRYEKPQDSASDGAQLLTEMIDVTRGFQVLTGAQSPFWTPALLKKADPNVVDMTITILTTQVRGLPAHCRARVTTSTPCLTPRERGARGHFTQPVAAGHAPPHPLPP